MKSNHDTGGGLRASSAEPNDNHIGRQEARKILHCSVATLRRRVRGGELPEQVDESGRRSYVRAQVEALAASNTVPKHGKRRSLGKKVTVTHSPSPTPAGSHDPGTVGALVFAALDAGISSIEIVKRFRLSAEVVRREQANWRSMQADPHCTSDGTKRLVTLEVAREFESELHTEILARLFAVEDSVERLAHLTSLLPCTCGACAQPAVFVECQACGAQGALSPSCVAIVPPASTLP